MYSERVLEIFKNPPHAGGLQGANGSGKYADEKSGDQIRVYFKTDDKDVVLEARFKALGSVASIVASSVLCSNIVGLTVKELQKLDSSFITENIDLPEDKQYVAQFVINALNVAIEDFFKNKEKEQKQEKESKQKSVKAKTAKKEVDQKAKEYAQEVKEKIEEENDNKQVSKTKQAFEEMFSAWDD